MKNSDINRHFPKCQGVGKKIGGGRPIRRENVQVDEQDNGPWDISEDEEREENYGEGEDYVDYLKTDSESEDVKICDIDEDGEDEVVEIVDDKNENYSDEDTDEDGKDNDEDEDDDVEKNKYKDSDEDEDTDNDIDIDSNDDNFEDHENKKRKLEVPPNHPKNSTEMVNTTPSPRRSKRKPMGEQLQEKMDDIQAKLLATHDNNLDLEIETFPEKGRGIVVSNLKLLFF